MTITNPGVYVAAAAIGAIALAFVAALIIAWQADRSIERDR